MAGALERLPDRQREQEEGRFRMAAQEASGGGGGVISAKEYVDVKVDGVRSDLQASIADLRAEVRGLAAKIEALPTTWTLVGTIAGGFAVSLGLIFTFRSYSNDNAEHVRARQQQLDEAITVSQQNARLIEQNSVRFRSCLARWIASLPTWNGGHPAMINRRTGARLL